MPHQTQLAIGRKLGVVVTTLECVYYDESERKKEKRGITKSTVTRIAASSLRIGDAVSCCLDVNPPAYLHRYCTLLGASTHTLKSTHQLQPAPSIPPSKLHTTHLVTFILICVHTHNNYTLR